MEVLCVLINIVISIFQKKMSYLNKKCGFDLQNTANHKDSLETFLRRFFFILIKTPNPLFLSEQLIKTDLLTFFFNQDELWQQIFYILLLFIFGFAYLWDLSDSDVFRKETGFPIIYGDLIENLYQLLSTRAPKKEILLDQLVSDGVLLVDNDYHYFNLARVWLLSLTDVIREVVYVESRVDTDQ